MIWDSVSLIKLNKILDFSFKLPIGMNSFADDVQLSTVSSEQLIYFLDNGSYEYVKDILSDFLRIPTLTIPNDLYNPKLEDDLFRGKILLDLFLNAAKYGLKIGFSAIQMQAWMIILRDTHRSYIEDSVQKEKNAGAIKVMEVFKSKLLQHSNTSRKIFLDIDLKRMIDYFRITYVYHINA